MISVVHKTFRIQRHANYTRLIWSSFKVSKGAKIRNRYNQVPHLTQDTHVQTVRESPDLNRDFRLFDNGLKRLYE